jgi:Asp-tRNA(Asn)/Glu-tRNA(Gln) amidotransferase A subunit family amidase
VADDLTELGAVEAARRIATGDLTSEALVKACLAKIDQLESSIQAWAFIDRDLALERAREADDQAKGSRGIGPLHGVPVGLKDIIDTADMPTENGSAAYKGRRPTADATSVAALRRAGAIVLGKTVTTELANLTPSHTRNPANVDHTPGGSSSGSAAAVAAGMVPLAVGTQTGGSVIRPASFCGTYGFKPTFGLIPRSGVLTQSPSLDTVGVFGRSVDDLAILADAMQAYDADDFASLRTSRGNLLATVNDGWTLPPLVAFVKTHAWSDADPATREAFGELVEALGSQAQEIIIDATTERGVAAAGIVQGVELSHHYGHILDRAPELLSKGLAERIEAGRRVNAVDYVAALDARQTYYRTVQELFTDYGTILTPAALGPAPKDHNTTGNPVFCAFWTYLGVPAVTLPLLEVDGMPLGVQLVGPRGDDGRLLRSARLFERFVQEKA